MLTLGDITLPVEAVVLPSVLPVEALVLPIALPVEALVLPNLGPDKMLLDNSIMGAFGATSNWHTKNFISPVLVSKQTQRIAYEIPQMFTKTISYERI